MDQVSQMIQYLKDTYLLYIIMEVVVIGVLLIFVRRWGRDYKNWIATSEAQKQAELENQLDRRLIEGSRRQF